MTTFVAMLRGINVGGNTPVKMDALRELVSSLGHHDVSTYIQSGNVLFRSRAASATKVEREIEARLKRDLGLDVTVMVRSVDQLARVVRENPFLPGSDPAMLYVIFLAVEPEAASIRHLDVVKVTPDEFRIEGREIYARYPNGYGRSKMTNAFFEGRLGVRGTARNWNTVTRLLQLAAGSAAKK